MVTFEPPILEKEYICITSSDVDLELLSAVSCYFNKTNVYFSIFKMPSAMRSQTASVSSEDEGYFSDIILNKSSKLINNCIARIKCRKIIYIGLSEEQKSYFEFEKYSKVLIIEINNLSDIKEKLDFLSKKFDGLFYCTRTEIAQGLICSKKYNKLLVVDDTVPSIGDYLNTSGKGLVVIELKNDISDIILSNYASSIDADVKFIEEYETHQLKEIKDNLIKWKREGSIGAYYSFASYINKAMKGIELEKYSYITFFTDGVPYGVLFNKIVPCSHVLRSLTEDLFIFNNIFYEQSDSYFASSIVFSPQPQDLGESPIIETENTSKALNRNNFYVKKLYNKNATVKAFDNYVGHYPYDILHICSHGGEIDGYYVIQEFADREGKKHTIEYEEVVGFSHNQGDVTVK